MKKLPYMLVVMALALLVPIVVLANGGTTTVTSAPLQYSGTGWGGWSCPSSHPFIVSAEVRQGTPTGPVVDPSTLLNSLAWKPGAAVGTDTYPTTPFGYTYGAGEEGWIVQNNGNPPPLYIVLTCEAEPEPEQCGRCSNAFVGWVEWVDRDGGCDGDYQNERVEFPFDDRCYTNCQGELTKTAGLSSAPRDNGEGQWITCTSFRYSDINTGAFCFAESECTVVYTTCDETVLNRSWTEETLTPEGAIEVTTFFEYIDSLNPEVVCRVTEEVEVVYESCLNAESTYEVPGIWSDWYDFQGTTKERSRTVEIFDSKTEFKCGEYVDYDQECFADDWIWVWRGCGCSIRDRTYDLYHFGSPPLHAQRAYCGCDFLCMDEGAWNDSGYVNNCQGKDYTYWDELPLYCGYTNCE